MKKKGHFYSIGLKKISRSKYAIHKHRIVFAKNYIEASRKLGVSAYAMRTYGYIVKGG